MIFVEKYRPKDLNSLIGVKEDITNLLTQDIPHLLLYGPPGTGKTSLARIIIKSLDAESIELNASDERGIGVIQSKVKLFSQTQSNNGKIKIVFLDEADFLTPEAQTALRNMMETYSKQTRFVLTANFDNKIIEPIQSRCVKIAFGDLDRKKIEERLGLISKIEGFSFKEGIISELVRLYYPDMRKMINKIQELGRYKREITLEDIKQQKIGEEIIELLKQNKFQDARKLYLNSLILPETLLNSIYEYIMDAEIDNEKKRNFVFIIADSYKWLNLVANKDILIDEFMFKLQAELK